MKMKKELNFTRDIMDQSRCTIILENKDVKNIIEFLANSPRIHLQCHKLNHENWKSICDAIKRGEEKEINYNFNIKIYPKFNRYYK